jgi:hypothetical protein
MHCYCHSLTFFPKNNRSKCSVFGTTHPTPRPQKLNFFDLDESKMAFFTANKIQIDSGMTLLPRCQDPMCEWGLIYAQRQIFFWPMSKRSETGITLRGAKLAVISTSKKPWSASLKETDYCRGREDLSDEELAGRLPDVGLDEMLTPSHPIRLTRDSAQAHALSGDLPANSGGTFTRRDRNEMLPNSVGFRTPLLRLEKVNPVADMQEIIRGSSSQWPNWIQSDLDWGTFFRWLAPILFWLAHTIFSQKFAVPPSIFHVKCQMGLRRETGFQISDVETYWKCCEEYLSFQILWLLLQDRNLKPKRNHEGETSLNEQRLSFPSIAIEYCYDSEVDNRFWVEVSLSFTLLHYTKQVSVRYDQSAIKLCQFEIFPMLTWHRKPINERVVITNHTKIESEKFTQDDWRFQLHKFIWIDHATNECEQLQLKRFDFLKTTFLSGKSWMK